MLSSIRIQKDMTENRNIIDYYHYWTTEAIKASLNSKRHNFSVLISNELNDFNIGTVIRNSNAFLARDVYVLGRKKFDRRGAVGTYIYENLKFIKSIEEISDPIISVDNVDRSIPIESFTWPDTHFVMAFGQEQVGISPEILDRSSSVVYITQYGSVRSLNVGTASGIAMYDFCRKLK